MKKSHIVALMIAILSIGCSNTVTVPQEVYIPVKCKINKTTSPTNRAIDENDYDGIRLNNESILIYTEILEHDIDFCIGDNK